MSRPTYRDWQPGDGITCAEAAKAPPEIPCGRPVRTAVVTSSYAGRRETTRTRALCAHHADIGVQPGEIMVIARKVATEKLIVEHWDEYRSYLTAAIAEHLQDEP